jgi:hypothetical protein
MAYTVTSDTVGLAIGPISETASDVHYALSEARQMYEDGMANVSIVDQADYKIGKNPQTRQLHSEFPWL